MVNAIDRDTQMCMSIAARPGNHGNRFHNFLYAELGLNFVYKSFTSSDVGATIAGVRSLGIRGVGVSMPHKESCLPFLDAVDASAQAIGSVNTIVNDGGVLTGHNTDYLAVRAMLDEHSVPRGEFAVLGSGGMAKAVVAALRDAGFGRGTVVAGSDLARAQALADRYGFAAAGALGDLRPQLLVNATPVGMAGGPSEHDLAFPEDAVHAAGTVLDVVHLPPGTPLVRLARSLGTQVLTGDEIMLRQALEQFVMYTGVRPTDEQVRRAEEYAAAG